jgi:hypothetical protein
MTGTEVAGSRDHRPVTAPQTPPPAAAFPTDQLTAARVARNLRAILDAFPPKPDRADRVTRRRIAAAVSILDRIARQDPTP